MAIITYIYISTRAAGKCAVGERPRKTSLIPHVVAACVCPLEKTNTVARDFLIFTGAALARSSERLLGRVIISAF